jgi:pyruvate carboxylase
LQDKALKGQAPYTVRPGSLLAEADLAALRTEAEARCGSKLDDDALAAYAMYPEVYAGFTAVRRRYGPVAVLPTPVFFYGMQPEQEIAIEIEPGKTLMLRLLTVSETDEEGNVGVFFELNGQPRLVKVPNRSAAARRPARRRADEGKPGEIGAPMPGSIAAILVREGQKVGQGEALMTIEAMKMQTQIAAPAAGSVKMFHVKPGDAVEAKDLLVELA